jgi:glycosyltransferase involved in cell wall biosynthesis
MHLNNHPLRDFYGVLAAKRLGIPAVSHLRSVRAGHVNSLKIDFLNTHVSRFIANSDFTRRHWVSLGLDDAKMTTVHNAIGPADVATLDIRREWGIKTRFVVGCVGNLSDSKGQDVLLRAFRQVLADEPDCTLLLVGDGAHRGSLTSLSRELKIDRSVIFAGYDRRAKAIIASLDVLAAPSVNESFGRTLLEAMAVRTPIVAARSGGIPEVVENGVNGLLADAGDVQSLAAAIVRLLHEPQTAKELVQAGERICRERFDLSRHVRSIEDIYASSLAS